MSFLIDTDICSAHLRGKSTTSSRFLQHSGRLWLSAVSLGELYTWVLRKGSSARHLEGLSDLLSDVTVLTVRHFEQCPGLKVVDWLAPERG